MTTDSTITPELLDQLLANYTKPEDLTGENGLFKQLKRALIERLRPSEVGQGQFSTISNSLKFKLSNEVTFNGNCKPKNN